MSKVIPEFLENIDGLNFKKHGDNFDNDSLADVFLVNSSAKSILDIAITTSLINLYKEVKDARASE